MAQMLDLDALILREHLHEIFNWIAAHQPAPSTIVDLGAGTGTGTLGLAQTFPHANLVAVDQSEFMLNHLTSAAQQQQLSSRISTQQIDLDSAWPKLSEIDLVWAASSMHHMSDPAAALSHINKMLAPGGLLAVVEMDTLPRYLPDNACLGAPGLEQRLHDAATLAGWNAHPDWAATIQAAGLVITAQRTFSYNTSEHPELIAQNALRFLSKIRDSPQGTLSAEDLATINQLLDPHSPHSVAKRADLLMRGSRTVWLARRAQ